MNNEIITGHPDRNWDEDFLHENGNYVNNCVSCRLYFRGHKRRVICKKCFSTPDPVKEESQEELFRKVVDLFNGQHKLYGRPDYQLLKERFTIQRK
jgi:hypothetical protein